jgi:hypothetical protein
MIGVGASLYTPAILGGFTFSPTVHFSAGEQGFLFDPYDLSTMYQDNSGLSPVTAAGQGAAIIQDKSGRGNHAVQATGSKRPTYQTTAGLRWLQTDGVSNSMLVPSFTPNSDKMQLFVAMRKNVSTAEIILESSTNAAGGSGGTFYLAAGESPSALYTFLSGGTSGASAGLRVAKITETSTYPEDVVVSATSDIATDVTSIEKDGVAGTPSTGDLGTGNFLAEQINIASRNQINTFLDGRIYGMMLRFGPNMSASEIDDMNTYMAGKAGVSV